MGAKRSDYNPAPRPPGPPCGPFVALPTNFEAKKRLWALQMWGSLLGHPKAPHAPHGFVMSFFRGRPCTTSLTQDATRSELYFSSCSFCRGEMEAA